MAYYVRVSYLMNPLDDEPRFTTLSSNLYAHEAMREALHDFSEWFHWDWPLLPVPPVGEIAFLGVFIGHDLRPDPMGKAMKEPVRRPRSGQRKGGNSNGRK